MWILEKQILNIVLLDCWIYFVCQFGRRPQGSPYGVLQIFLGNTLHMPLNHALHISLYHVLYRSLYSMLRRDLWTCLSFPCTSNKRSITDLNISLHSSLPTSKTPSSQSTDRPNCSIHTSSSLILSISSAELPPVTNTRLPTDKNSPSVSESEF